MLNRETELKAAPDAKEVGNKGANKKKRFAELDFIRGICVILMVFDHFMYDCYAFFPEGSAISEFALRYWVSDFRYFWHWTVVTVFFLLCGIGCTLSRSNLKRGLICFGAACFLTWGTYILETSDFFESGEVFIEFGVLHMLGVSMLLYALIDFFAKKLGKKIGIFASFLPALVGVIMIIVFFTCIFSHGEGEFLFGKEYSGSLGDLAALIGYETNMASADYFPILPYSGIVLLGSALGIIYKNRETSLIKALEHKAVAPINFVGRHALIIYVLHQVVLASVVYLVALMVS